MTSHKHPTVQNRRNSDVCRSITNDDHPLSTVYANEDTGQTMAINSSDQSIAHQFPSLNRQWRQKPIVLR